MARLPDRVVVLIVLLDALLVARLCRSRSREKDKTSAQREECEAHSATSWLELAFGELDEIENGLAVTRGP